MANDKNGQNGQQNQNGTKPIDNPPENGGQNTPHEDEPNWFDKARAKVRSFAVKHPKLTKAAKIITGTAVVGGTGVAAYKLGEHEGEKKCRVIEVTKYVHDDGNEEEVAVDAPEEKVEETTEETT